MGTNVYMRRIPTAKQKEELKQLLKNKETSLQKIISKKSILACNIFVFPIL